MEIVNEDSWLMYLGCLLLNARYRMTETRSLKKIAFVSFVRKIDIGVYCI